MFPHNAYAASAKITICHRTHSVTNPYRLITVSTNAVNKARGHKIHTGGVFVTTPAYYLSDGAGTNPKVWGDIIPGGDAAGLIFNGTNSIGNNWDTNGKTFFQGGANASKCGRMTPTQFYTSEKAAGESDADILQDLNEQDANEDLAIKTALGGSFTLANITTADTLITATTSAATSVLVASATLNGTVKSGSTNIQWTFEYGTSSTLATSTRSPLNSSLATAAAYATDTAKSSSISGLSASTVYYFRIITITDYNLVTEGILYGSILNFTTPAASTSGTAQAINFPDPADKIYGDANFSISATSNTTATPAVATGLTVSFNSQSDVCTVGVSTITAGVSSATVSIVSAGDCIIVASQDGNETYNPATNVPQTIVISPKPLVITAGTKSKIFGDANPTFSASPALGALVGSDTLSSTYAYSFTNNGGTSYGPSSTPPTNVGSYLITPSNAVFDTPSDSLNYTITYATGPYTITVKSIVITAVDKSKVVGAADPVWSYTYSASLIGSDLVDEISRNFAGTGGTTYAASTTPPANVGTYSITPTALTLSSGLASNYLFSFVAGTHTITEVVSTPAPRTTSPNPAKDPGPKIKLKDPAPKSPIAAPTAPNLPNKKPAAPPTVSNPLPKETLSLLNEDNEEIKILEVKSNSPVKSKINENGKVELIVPIGFKGEIEIEVTSQNGGPSEKLKIPVEGPKPSVEPKEAAKELPRLSPEKPGEVKVISGDNKVTLSWVKEPEAKSYDIYSENKLVCATVYSVCTLPAENGLNKKYEVVPVMNNGAVGTMISGSGKALPSGTLLAIVYFDTDKSNLRSDARATLNKLVNDLYALGLREVSLSGHTDTQASSQYNNKLSSKRSKIVDAFLGKAVVDAYLTKDSFSENDLAVKTKDEVNQQLNRRVEIRVK